MRKLSIQIEQAFFGNDQSGYRLLACTATRYSSLVTEYCNAIGTPEGFSELSPFLFSVPVDDAILMFCGQCGEPDASGRQTLFFHAMIANRASANDFNVNAFSLFAAGYFSKKNLHDCRPLVLAKPLASLDTVSKPFVWNGESMAIVSGKVEKQLIRGLLGTQVNSVAWASFAFQPLDKFKLYVISKYVNRPVDRKCVLVSGQALPPVKSVREENSTRNNTSQIHRKPIPKTVKRNWILALSIFVNFILGYMVLTTEKTKEAPIKVEKVHNEEKTAYKAHEVKQEITREDIISHLSSFPKEKQIADFTKIIEKSERLKAIRDKPDPQADEDGLLSKIDEYIKFVNKWILNPLTPGDNK